VDGRCAWRYEGWKEGVYLAQPKDSGITWWGAILVSIVPHRELF